MRRSSNQLTRRQSEMLTAINEYTAAHNYSPTVRELGATLGHASCSTTHGILVQLERKGFISRNPKQPRTIQITGHNPANPHIGISVK